MGLDNRTELHDSEEEILKYFIKFCNSHELTYFMMGGSLLGTIRHKGFIPWDDDIDVGMPRPDYEKLIDLLIHQEDDKFIFKNFKNSDIKTYFSRIENSKVKIEDRSANKVDVRNSWIDIFPIDGMPNNIIKRKMHEFKLLYTRMLLQYSQFDEIVNTSLTERPWHENILINLGKIIKPERFLKKNKLTIRLDNSLKKYNYNSSKYVVNFMGAYKFKEMFPKEFYENIGYFKFDDINVRCSKNYNEILTKMYGENYMLPPSEMVKNKHFSKVIKNQ